MPLNKLSRIILFIGIVFLIEGCTEKKKNMPLVNRGGEVRIALHSSIDDIFPFTTDEINVEQIHKYMISPSLVAFDANGEAQPDLADGWSVDDDNRVVTYILNSDMKWSNGRSVRTEERHIKNRMTHPGLVTNEYYQKHTPCSHQGKTHWCREPRRPVNQGQNRQGIQKTTANIELFARCAITFTF